MMRKMFASEGKAATVFWQPYHSLERTGFQENKVGEDRLSPSARQFVDALQEETDLVVHARLSKSALGLPEVLTIVVTFWMVKPFLEGFTKRIGERAGDLLIDRIKEYFERAKGDSEILPPIPDNTLGRQEPGQRLDIVLPTDAEHSKAIIISVQNPTPEQFERLVALVEKKIVAEKIFDELPSQDLGEVHYDVRSNGETTEWSSE